MNENFTTFISGIRRICSRVSGEEIPLHAPVFVGNESKYVLNAIDSTFVSSVGAYVTRFEDMLREVTGAKYAIACVNGTSALHVALHLAGVRRDNMVITQALSFVATGNAIVHCGADPIFLDVDAATLGLSPETVADFLHSQCERVGGGCRHKATGRRVAACVPMHTFGLPCRLEKLIALCADWRIPLVEDAAEALGSKYQGKHCGTFGLLGILSFNGNKIVTTGGGGAILTNDAALGALAKHLTTTAKIPHAWEFRHDATAWNYRMPNLNAALGCAQLEWLDAFVDAKRGLARAYAALFSGTNWEFVTEGRESHSNYWLSTVRAPDRACRDALITVASTDSIQCRPAWEPLHTLPMYTQCLRDELTVTMREAMCLVSLPSSAGCI